MDRNGKNSIWIFSFLCLIALLLSACATSRLSPQGKQYLQQGKASFLAQDYPDAFKQLMIPAMEGDPSAQYAIGYMYYYGKGTKRNKTTGKRWIKKAASQGHKTAIKALKAMRDETPQSTY